MHIITADGAALWVAYLAPDLAGRRHFPDELLRPFLLALAVRRLVCCPRSSGGSGPRAAVLRGGRSPGLLVRESGTAVSARCRSLPFHEPRRAAQRLHSGSPRRHPPLCLLPMHWAQSYSLRTIKARILPRRAVHKQRSLSSGFLKPRLVLTHSLRGYTAHTHYYDYYYCYYCHKRAGGNLCSRP